MAAARLHAPESCEFLLKGRGVSDSPLVIFHLDMKVAQFKRSYLKSLFSRLRRVGYTHVCFEIEDKVRLDVCPEAAWVEACSKEEFSSILGDARQAGLEPIPLVQTFGHLEYVLRHGRFVGLREEPRAHAQICPSNPEAVKFVREMCAEVRELFGNPDFFHVGGDETRSLGVCPACARRVASAGAAGIYLEHVRAVSDPLIAAGARPILWADMALAHPEVLDGMPREVVFCDWDYWTGDGSPETVLMWAGGQGVRLDTSEAASMPETFLSRYAEFLYPNGTSGPAAAWFYTDYLRSCGYDVIVAPSARCAGDNMFFPRAVHVPNCIGACARALIDRRARGVMITSWAVRLNHLETQWLSIAAPALVASTGRRRRVELMERAAELLGIGGGDSLWRVQEALGPALPLGDSLGPIRDEIYGMRHDLAGEVKRLFADERSARAREHQVEERLAAYDAVEPSLASICAHGRGDLVDTRHWLAALRGLRQKGHQFLALAEIHRQRKLSEPPLAAVEHELAQVWDETAACLEGSYTPATLHRELMMRFGAERRFVMPDGGAAALPGDWEQA